ncbi:MAG: UDP-3-O-(3-hydroxymyristoyl)glucosamine N-acyltransferase [Bacteroidia bacterium]
MKIPTHTLPQIAELLGCPYAGPPDLTTTGINEIHRVEVGDITFVDVQKYYRRALQSPASIILINQKIDPPAGKGLIYSSSPFRDFNRLLEYFQPTISPVFAPSTNQFPGVSLGHHVVIGEGVEIGPGCQIGHNVVIGPYTRIAAHTIIHSNVTIYPYTQIGAHVIIHGGCVIGADAFYYKRHENGSIPLQSKGRVVIGNYVVIGANTTIDRGVTSDTFIGDHTKIDNLVQIGHDTIIGKNCQIASQVGIAGACILEDDVILWGQVGIPSGIRIEKGATVLAKSGVLTSLEAGKVYFGFVAKEVKKAWREIATVGQLPQLLRMIEASQNGQADTEE